MTPNQKLALVESLRDAIQVLESIAKHDANGLETGIICKLDALESLRRIKSMLSRANVKYKEPVDQIK